MTLKVTNPFTGELVRTVSPMSASEVHQAITGAEHAYFEWRKTSFDERVGHLRRIASTLRDRVGEMSRLMALEMGKPIVQGEQEIEKCAWVCEHFADNAETYLETEIIETEASKSFTTFSPLGIVLAIVPWSFPFWDFFRCAAPALMSGNAVLFQHASNVPGCSSALEEMCLAGGLPQGLVKTLLIGEEDGKRLVRDRRIEMVILTGRDAQSREIASSAGGHSKKIIFERGSSDPYIVLADADVELAARTCVAARLVNSGQSNIAAKRMLVVTSQLERFQHIVVEIMKLVEGGDPLKEQTVVGPMATDEGRRELHDQVQRSVQAGAQCLLGGELPEGPGFFYPATVLTDVRPGMAVHDEETYGPVATIVPVADAQEAIEIANGTGHGLGAAIFTADVERGERIAVEELRVGSCAINAHVRSDPRLAFGGVRGSGFGRLLGRAGIREVVNAKSIWIS